MAEIITSKGMLDEGMLEKTEGFVDNEVEYTTWQEWRLDGEIVKRSVHVRLKQAVVTTIEAGTF